MSNKSIKKNYLYNVAYEVLTIFTPLITTPYISKVLGPDDIGRVSYTASIVSYFVMFATLGTSLYGAREIAYFQEEKKKRTQVFWNNLILRLICVLTCITGYGFYLFIIKQKDSVSFIFSINILAVLFDVTWLFQGMELFSKIVVRNAVFKLIGVISIFTFVHNKRDLIPYVIGITVIPALGNITLWPFLKEYIGKMDLKDLHPFQNLRECISLFIPTIAVSIYTVLDKTIIGIVDPSGFENGYYEQATKISKMILTILTSLGTVIVPRIGFLFNKNQNKKVKEYMYMSYRFVWMMGIPLCLGLIAVSDNMVPWFFGEEYKKVIILLKVLAILILAIGVNNVTGVQYFIPTKRQSLFTFTVIMGAITNLVLNILFIPKFHSFGASIASVLAETVIAVVQIFIIRRELSVIEIIRPLPKYLLSGIVMFTIVRFEGTYFKPTIIHTGLMVISGAFIYIIMLLFLQDNFFKKYMLLFLVKFKEICRKV